MPERNATLPLWNEEELKRNVQAYASRYNAVIGPQYDYRDDDDNQFDWVQEELDGMDFVMQACCAMDGVPVEVWDKFHTRWREAYLLQVHIVINPNYQFGDEFAEYMAARLQDFFNEDIAWLQQRPNNN